jgi:DNA-binding MarR family transcriptional regulator
MGDHDQPLWRQAATHTLHTSLLLKAVLEQRLHEETGMLLADNEALLNIGHSDEPLRMSDIANRLVLSPGGATKVIDRLEEMGFVARHPDPDDRRATVVEITDTGREAMQRNRVIIDEGLQAVWADHVTDDEARLIVEVMNRVVHARKSAD